VFELAVECFEPSGFSGDHRFELHDPLLPAVVESFTVGVAAGRLSGVVAKPAAYAPNNNITAGIADRARITERVELLSVDHRR
jgi:hypothetical protein